ncbi:MAG: hypothetical protein MJ241_01115 [Bacilli bacterium]|nr:hypothetical protein [Bacilli bacterium]
MKEDELLTPGQRFRKYFAKNLPMTVIFIMAVIIVFGLAIIATETMYITIPFLLIPALFTTQVICADVEAGIGFTNKGITSSFGKYLMGPFRGCYRVIRSFFFALLIGLGITAIFVFAYVGIGMSFPSFSNSLEQFLAISEEDVVAEGINAIILTFPDIAKMVISAQLVEGFAFTMSFSHLILSSAPLAILHGSPLALDKRAFNMLFKGAIKKDRKNYTKKYAKFAWIPYLLLGIGYILGVVISALVMLSIGYISLGSIDNYLIATVFSMFSGVMFGLILASFSLPYFFYSIEDLTFGLMPSIRDYSLELARNNLEQLRRYQQITEEEAKRYEEEIKKAEEELNNLDEDDTNSL